MRLRKGLPKVGGPLLLAMFVFRRLYCFAHDDLTRFCDLSLIGEGPVGPVRAKSGHSPILCSLLCSNHNSEADTHYWGIRFERYDHTRTP